MAQSDENTLTTGQTDPGACPHGHGHIFQGCIAYINSYIDIRAKQLYAKIKEYVLKVAGKYNGPWSHIVLSDENSPDTKYRVFVKDGSLRTREMQEYEENHETDALYERLQKVTANVTNMKDITGLMEGDVAEIDAQITTLESDVSTLNGRISTLTSSVNSIQRTVNNMGVDVRTMGRSVTSLESRVAELERNGTEGWESELDPNVYVTTTTFDSTVNSIKGSIAGLNNQINGLNTLYANCETLQSNQTDIQGQVNSIGARVSTLETDVNSLKNRVSTIEGSGGSTSGGGESGGESGHSSWANSELMEMIEEEQEQREDADSALDSRVRAVERKVQNLGNLASYNMQFLTQAQYNELENKDEHTFYFIIQENQ